MILGNATRDSINSATLRLQARTPLGLLQPELKSWSQRRKAMGELEAPDLLRNHNTDMPT